MTDRGTDRGTDGRALAYTRYSIYAVARNDGPPNHSVRHLKFVLVLDLEGYSVTPKLKVWGVTDSHSFLVDAQI